MKEYYHPFRILTLKGVKMERHKTQFVDFSGFVGKEITILHSIGLDQEKQWTPIISGKVYGVFVNEYNSDNFIKTSVTFFVGDIPSEDALYYSNDKIVYARNKNSIIPSKIYWENAEIYENFSDTEKSRYQIVLK